MDSLKDLLLKRDLDQPSELKSIHDYCEKFLAHPFVVIDYPKHTTICVENSKVAYVLRTKMDALIAYAAPTKKIHIRIDASLHKHV